MPPPVNNSGRIFHPQARICSSMSHRTLLPAVMLLGAPLLPAATWQIDTAHSAAQFAVRHMMISTVRGEFGGIKGTVDYDPANPASARIDVTIDVSTVTTREPKRDSHLKSPDFFDVGKFPTMTFQSKRVEAAGAGKLKVIGDLTMHGVTREVVLDVEGPSAEMKDARGGSRLGASATTKISRKDFGMTWNRAVETGGVVVSDEIAVTLDVELVRRPAK
jgi:polyisoprenoid-binding protein YceI